MNGAAALFNELKEQADKVIIGKDLEKKLAFATFLARGHVLLEGVPGVAKTLLAKTMAQALGMRFSRIQFTPDLMPSDITGTNIFHREKKPI